MRRSEFLKLSANANANLIRPAINRTQYDLGFDLFGYDRYVICFSGGKDSVACFLLLFASGVDLDKIELAHNEVDGREGSTLMDWPITPDYCRKFGAAFGIGIPVYFSWKVGGFEREMLREKSLTAPTKFETPGGEVIQIGGTRGKPNTRRQFPQVSANLSVRWCSAYLKIDVGAAAIRNQDRFNNSRTLVISGERAEESAARAKYNEFEPDRADNRNGRSARHVDRWRPVHKWSEAEVWAIIRHYGVVTHPAYDLGFARVSCQFCIFGSDNQMASCQTIGPSRFGTLQFYESEFRKTIHRSKSMAQRAKAGTSYQMAAGDVKLALCTTYDRSILTENWKLPQGAFGESCGPT